LRQEKNGKAETVGKISHLEVPMIRRLIAIMMFFALSASASAAELTLPPLLPSLPLRYWCSGCRFSSCCSARWKQA
jgi:hypothetical protein